MASDQNVQKVILVKQKSMAMVIILAILFGPLGMLYSTVSGGVVMLIVNIVVGLFTLGFGLFLTWPICVVWAAVAANSHNKKILES